MAFRKSGCGQEDSNDYESLLSTLDVAYDIAYCEGSGAVNAGQGENNHE